MRLGLAALLVALLLTGLAGVLSLLVSSRDKPGVTLANFEKLKAGMTRAEVEELLGGPPGEYGDPRWRTASEIDPSDESPDVWSRDGWVIVIYFGDDGRLRSKQIHNAMEGEPWFQELFAWLWPRPQPEPEVEVLSPDW
jgi:hypothetical protein